MLDKRLHALRYLLQRHVWSLKGSVDSSLYKEVSKSVLLERNGVFYKLSWRRNGKLHLVDVQRSDFEFYVRGDLATSDQNRVSSRKNDEGARKLALLLLGLSDPGQSCKTTSNSNLTRKMWSWLSYVLGSIILYVFGGSDSTVLALALPILFVCEYWFMLGKFGIPFVLVILSISYPITAVLGGMFFAIIQFLDPDKSFRKTRVLLGWTAAAFGISQLIEKGRAPELGLWLVPFCLAGFLTFVFRWTSGSHTHSFPLIFPVFPVGLYLDGFVTLAWITLFLAIVSAIYAQKGHLLFKIQRATNLTPNG